MNTIQCCYFDLKTLKWNAIVVEVKNYNLVEYQFSFQEKNSLIQIEFYSLENKIKQKKLRKNLVFFMGYHHSPHQHNNIQQFF